MATSTTTVFPFNEASRVAALARPGLKRRRRISPAAGHALEILGHAIEYLTDEYVFEGGNFSGSDPRIQAIEMLMAVNRAIYFDCPEVPTMGQRWRAWLRRFSSNR